MPVNDNDIRVKRTKKLIKKGLTELSKTKCITKITVKELTDHIEINRGTFYLHYKDIYELIDAIENELYEEINARLSEVSPIELIKRPVDICERVCDHLREHTEIYAMLMGEHGDAQFTHKIGELMNEKIYSIFKRIFPNMDDTRFDFAYSYGKFGLIGLMDCWCTKHPEWTSRQVAEMWLKLTVTGLWGIIGEEAKGALLDARNSD